MKVIKDHRVKKDKSREISIQSPVGDELGVTFLNWLNFGYKCLPDFATLKPVKTSLVLNVGQ